MTERLAALRAQAEAAKARHRASAMCEVPRTCGGCHWWSGFLGALDELEAERPHPAFVGNIVGDTTPKENRP